MIKHDISQFLPVPDEFTLPNYADGSIANVPATIAKMLGVQLTGLSALPEVMWRPLGGVKRVVLLTLDGFGWNLFQARQDLVTAVSQRATITNQLTSIFPSTTVAALSSLWTGSAPAQHGLVGLKLFFPEFAVSAGMLDFSPLFYKAKDALVDAGLDPETFLQHPGVGEQLGKVGIPTYAFKGKEIANSVLSQMHGRGVTESFGMVSFADMLVQMRELLHKRAGEPLFINAYWPSIDTISHYHTWQGTPVAAELRAIIYQLQTEFFDALTDAARQDTAFFIVADHGQELTPLSHQIFLSDHPQLEQMLFMRPTGEPRVLYLYTKHGCREATMDYINTKLGHAMTAVPAQAALQAGLLGPEPFAANVADRLGDVIVIMRGGYTLFSEVEREWAHKMIGRHGGLTHAEMQVPWLGFRLDGW
ncbi:alkaline phosphatase family protein [Candidatus Leptofilum sp.]|uniref:alkaline phosphatase family protein n=1 Tax=Candidatus Leptofilum sp. TaxID=3241576 RepID=UPI003B59822E